MRVHYDLKHYMEEDTNWLVLSVINFMISSWLHRASKYWTLFYYQLTHTMLKNVELLKHYLF